MIARGCPSRRVGNKILPSREKLFSPIDLNGAILDTLRTYGHQNPESQESHTWKIRPAAVATCISPLTTPDYPQYHE